MNAPTNNVELYRYLQRERREKYRHMDISDTPMNRAFLQRDFEIMDTIEKKYYQLALEEIKK